jgi:CspA family cold shock protein|tara:strand:+ start:432 stop:635 length:204 start_codon:yes stop_codon:yes gene_type:complete
MKKGIVKEYDSLKGFGFITGEDNEDYFVHVSGLREHLKAKGLRSGQRVSFDVDFGMKGDKAINVRTD